MTPRRKMKWRPQETELINGVMGLNAGGLRCWSSVRGVYYFFIWGCFDLSSLGLEFSVIDDGVEMDMMDILQDHCWLYCYLKSWERGM